MSNLLKKRSFRRCVVATLSLMLFVSMVFGGVPGVGKADDMVSLLHFPGGNCCPDYCAHLSLSH